MKHHIAFPVILLLTCGAIIAENSGAERAANAAAFAQLKSPVGEWEANSSMGKTHVSYELVAGGTALLERESGEKMPTMLTVYHLDGDRLILTHYCMAGNQPRMVARSFKPETGEIEFKFLDATNLANPNAGHMRNAKFRVVDAKTMTQQWDFYENGKIKMTETANYTRLK